jgi:hypothetical protein
LIFLVALDFNSVYAINLAIGGFFAQFASPLPSPKQPDGPHAARHHEEGLTYYIPQFLILIKKEEVNA